MSRAARGSSALILGLVVLLALLTRGIIPVSGQAPARAPAAARPTADQMAPFVGNWVVTLTVMANQATFGVDVKNDGGSPSATVHADGQPTVNVTDVTVSGKSLVLKYVTQAMNTTLSTGSYSRRTGRARAPRWQSWTARYQMAGSAGGWRPGETVTLTGFGGGGGASPTSEATDFTPKPPYLAADTRGGGGGLHAADRLSPGAGRVRSGRDQPDDHRVRRQRPHVRRRDDQLHDGRGARPASTTRSAASAAGRARRATATTTSTPSSPTISSRRG